MHSIQINLPRNIISAILRLLDGSNDKYMHTMAPQQKFLFQQNIKIFENNNYFVQIAIGEACQQPMEYLWDMFSICKWF